MNSEAPKRLLIVDDDPAMLRLLKDKFTAEGYEVITRDDPEEALHYVQMYGLPHLALIDLRMGAGAMDGFELSHKLKALGDMPIVFVTANRDVNTIVEGLSLYADDYVVKPFEIRELAVRVQRVLSRITDYGYLQSPVIEVDDWLRVDFGNSRIWAGDRWMMLTPIEANLLHILMRNAGRVVTSNMLIARVWPADEVYEDTLRVHMHRLRRKVEPDVHHPRYIMTERGIGYRFIVLDVPRARLSAAFP